MDIRKLQRAIVDGLEDVKAQDIAVFNTEHLSPLFERVIVASGNSNRQTKALAASVRDAVRDKGFPVMRTEGEDNGEWIIVDCGAAVAHIMQPAIRQYYHLEEIWGGKPVKMKFGADVRPTGLAKASEPDIAPPSARAGAKAAGRASASPASGRRTGAGAGRAADPAARRKTATKSSTRSSTKAAAPTAAKPSGRTTPKAAAPGRKPAAKTAPRSSAAPRGTTARKSARPSAPASKKKSGPRA